MNPKLNQTSSRKENSEREILILPDGTVWINALNQELVPMAAALDPTGLFGPFCG